MLKQPDSYSYIWRAVREDDLDGLAALDLACRQVDGEVSVPARDYRQVLAMPGVQALCAVPRTTANRRDDQQAQIAAVGWIEPGETQTLLRGKVHPLHRRIGLGTYLLHWLEEQASNLHKSTRLIIRNEAFNAGSGALYEQQGYALDFVEQWMERDLRSPLPTIDQTFDHVPWTAANSHQFFEVYYDAFQTRPGFCPVPAEDWISEYVDDPDFRADESLLSLSEGQPVGFVTSGINPISGRDMPVGWISQIGVRQSWRGRGVAAGLIVAVMTAFRSEGLTTLGLHVNLNNSGAIRLYEKLGFKVIGHRAKFFKPRVTA